MANIADLINDSAWRSAVQAHVAARAIAGAVAPENQTAARARLNRMLVASQPRQYALAGDLVTTIAMNVSIRAEYEANGTWIENDVNFVVEQQMIARAAAVPTDYEAIVAAVVNPVTLHTLEGAFFRAANDVLADGQATAARKTWVRDHVATHAKVRETVAEFAGLLLTTSQLRSYGGDLAGVTDAEIAAAIGGFLTNWVGA